LAALVNVVLLHNMRSVHDLSITLSLPSVRKHMVFAESVEKQKKVIEHVATFWNKSIQRLKTVLDAMQTEGVLSGRAIVEWVLLDLIVAQNLQQPHYWEILVNAVDKVVQQARAVHQLLLLKAKQASEETAGVVVAAAEGGQDGNSDSADQDAKMKELQRQVSDLEVSFGNVAQDVSATLRALLQGFGAALSSAGGQQQSSAAESHQAVDFCTLLLNKYHKLMPMDAIASVATETRLGGIVKAASYYSRWDTLAYLPSTDDSTTEPWTTLQRDTDFVKKMQSKY
jgi:MIF4G like